MSNKIKRQFLKALYFKKDIDSLLKKYQVENETLRLWKRKWIIRDVCKYCNKKVKEEDFDISSSYWNNFLEVCHKQCKEKGDKREEIKCQKIDENCNDCKYLERKGFDKNTIDKQGQKLFNKIGCYFGICKKFNKKVTATRNMCQGNKCFKHRIEKEEK